MGFQEDDCTYLPGFVSPDDGTKSQSPRNLGRRLSSDFVYPGGDGDIPHSAEASPAFQAPLPDDSAQSGSRPPSPRIDLHSVKLQSVRQRTAQACDKCRERKTKCSGNRPVCLRCINRGLICEYSIRESRIRLPMRTSYRALPPIVLPNPLQVNFHDIVRPTPAHHSRFGNCQRQAFVSSPFGTYTTSRSSRRPMQSTLSYSGARHVNSTRANTSRQSTQDLGTHYDYAGSVAVSVGHEQINGQDPTWILSRSRSQSSLAQYGSPLTVAAADALFSMAGGSGREETDFSFGHNFIYEDPLRGRASMASIQSEELEPNLARRMTVPDALYRGTEHINMDASSSLSKSPNGQDHRPASTSSASSGQNNFYEHEIQHYPKEVPMDFHIPMYRSYQRSGGYSDWIKSSSIGLPQLPEPMSILAVHYASHNDTPAEEADFCSPYGQQYTGASSASTPSSASNTSGSSSQAGSTAQLELACPAPIMPIGSGAYDLHDEFQHHPGVYSMLPDFGHQFGGDASVRANIQYEPYSSTLVSDPRHRFDEYDFFK